MFTTLQLPKTLIGLGALSRLGDELASLSMMRPLVVVDRGIVKAGLSARLLAGLDTRFAPVLFDSVTENNVFADADGGGELYRREQCDGVIALGGGSVIDTAKCIAVLAANNGSIADFALNPDVVIPAAAPIVAIPTTAGTGSEADIFAGIHPDSETRGVGLASPLIMPKLAILDAELTVSLPAPITAATGIDALSHCIEGYLSKLDVPFAKMIALNGISRGMQFLRRAVREGGDLEARQEMLLAAYAGGVAMSMGTGPAHAIALTCSEQGFPHGILSGIGIVATLDVMGAHQPEAMKALDDAMGVGPGETAAQLFADLMRELGLPATLGELGYRVDDLDATVGLVHAHFCNSFARYHPSSDEYKAMMSHSLAARAA